MSEIQTVTRPRPMAGHVAIAPIPASREGEPTRQTAFGGMFVIEIESGYLAGIVLEIGELPEPLRDHQEYATPYGLGATVYYPERAAIALKGFHYVTMQAIIAWEEAQ